MLSLDQVRLLENRVEKAVTKIQSLVAENTRLRSQLSGLQAHANELEGLVRAFKDDQGRIEEGILNALDRLSAFEDSMSSTKETVSVASVTVTAAHANLDSAASDEDAPAQTGQLFDAKQSTETESSQTNITIDADWQNSTEETQTIVSPANGQMDIF